VLPFAYPVFLAHVQAKQDLKDLEAFGSAAQKVSIPFRPHAGASAEEEITRSMVTCKAKVSQVHSLGLLVCYSFDAVKTWIIVDLASLRLNSGS
jgi:hypothetical protein